MYVNIVSDKGLASNRRPAIIWPNDDPFNWPIYTSPGLNELKKFPKLYNVLSLTHEFIHSQFAPKSTSL